ncbi:MAG TPA: methyltransferase domain-containing protein [Bryobacteraceae bacterium]|nr:methyltransferase domain-containing protein [Bryobacteraceae bacterium]
MSGWDAVRYQDKHSFVWRYGADLLDLLAPQPGERILDLGCGTGQLTAEIARRGAKVTGLDQSEDMLDEARKNFPEIPFLVGDAARFSFPEPFDAVFSNAVLHWVKDAEGAAASMARALRPGGRLVVEFGGKDNTASVMAALYGVLGPTVELPWYYPSIGEYAPILERHGLEVRQATLFDRPTPLDGENGMEHWLRMFGPSSFLKGLTPERADSIIEELVARLRPQAYINGVWTVDYRRLRVMAVRE